ncbi:tetratricopeptide repeat protein [Thalassotalea eurytherma]|uniref:Tetratricopeptide repeat protein n=1 Tax=Thalassotalea eurytherma TaxID=1144278 RepID=A0ABQ6H6C1_9GAMM|nr:multiheme c-type cytochrome [Thalassotalea eurytherma]GLX82367.1 hypothetical protein theurythT_18190 [Thalassotalea eurytherma]
MNLVTHIKLLIVTTLLTLACFSFSADATEKNKDLTCIDCHENQANAWKDSHHFHAMATIDTPTNLGDFTQGSINLEGGEVHFYKEGNKYFVNMPNVDSKPIKIELTHTFGYEPLQQFMFDAGKGKYQFIPYAWDSRPAKDGGQRWHNLYPNSDPSQEFHWTQMGQNWNQNCADCHSTNFKKGFELETMSYESTYDAINVSCTACHQGTEEHLKWTKNPVTEAKHFGFSRSIAAKHPIFTENAEGRLVPVDRAKGSHQVETCAQCHSRRAQLSDHKEEGEYFDHYLPALLDAHLYYPDGQIYDEVYVYGSFTQSKMYKEGVTCTNCHDPHSTQLKLPGNVTCTQCHSAPKYDAPKHTNHAVGSEGAQCVNCHLPSTRYMGVDDRRDHSFKVPRPDLSVNLGVPNACQNCHEDVSNIKHAKQVSAWFPLSKYRQNPNENFAYTFAQMDGGDIQATPKLVEIAENPDTVSMVKASAISRVNGARNNEKLITFIGNQLKSDDPLVVIAAVRATQQLTPINRTLKLLPVLNHKNVAVRMSVGRALAANLADPTFKGERREKVQRAVDEYIAAQDYQADRGTAQTNVGQIYAMMGAFDKAEAAFKQSIQVEPIFMPAYIYLADKYRQQQKEHEAEQVLLDAIAVNPKSSDIYYQLALAKVRQKDRGKAIEYFDLAIAANDQSPRLFYTRAVLHQENKNLLAAKQDYAAAYKLHQRNPDYLYRLIILLVELKEYDSAIYHAQKLGQLMPNNPQVNQLIEQINAMK